MEELRCEYTITRNYPLRRVWTLTTNENKNNFELKFNWINPTILTNNKNEIVAKISNYKLISFWKRISLCINTTKIEGKILNKFNSVEILVESNIKGFEKLNWKWKLGEFKNSPILEDINTDFILAEFNATPFSYLEVGKVYIPLAFPKELRVFIAFTASYSYKKVLYAERVQ